ncbi:head-tail connector protein [Advenella sp. EE-W14]|uniref:head-tail connector protein n=1 Tax=Advenella sp. EE-W14 TaxID=2722705 RepID=UPI00145C8D8B|nr:head-tail connector protein [Advenella sp. EE-W14]
MIDLALVKQQLRVQHDIEDDLLSSYLQSAIAHVEQHCDRKIVETPASEAEMAMTPDVTQAILLLVGHWYANREAVVIGAVPSAIQLGVDRLLWYRKRF